MKEKEAKIPLDDPGPLRDALRAAGASARGLVIERDVILDTPDLELSSNASLLRVRHEKTRYGDETTVVTFKGPPEDSPYKVRPEKNFRSDLGPGEMVVFFGDLGNYRPIASYEKKREIWELRGVQVLVDELPGLGFFVEVEGEDEKAIEETIRTLRIKGHHEPRSYLELLKAHFGSQQSHFRFE